MDWTSFFERDLDTVFDWAEGQRWCQAMSACPQDHRWHSEGDVWTHTKLVCRQLIQLEEFVALEHRDQKVVLAAALFHDVAKPDTSLVDPETGAITSPKHALKGEMKSRSILQGIGCEPRVANHISSLVRLHGKPVFLSEKQVPENEVVRASLTVDNFLLFLLAKADNLGRETLATDRNVEEMEYWKLLATEMECLRKPYDFPNDHARFLFGQRLSDDRCYEPFEEYSATVTFMCGLPGSGKDTWIRKNRPEVPVVSLDQIRKELGIRPEDNQGQVAQEAKERCKQFLRAGVSFVFNATNTTSLNRSRWISLFHSYRARIEIAYLDPPLEDVQKQNKNRTERVPESVILKLSQSFQPPTLLECHGLIYGEE